MPQLSPTRKKKHERTSQKFEAIDVKSLIKLRADGLEINQMQDIFNTDANTIRRVYASYNRWAEDMAAALNKI
jgi:hypothetical protein